MRLCAATHFKERKTGVYLLAVNKKEKKTHINTTQCNKLMDVIAHQLKCIYCWSVHSNVSEIILQLHSSHPDLKFTSLAVTCFCRVQVKFFPVVLQVMRYPPRKHFTHIDKNEPPPTLPQLCKKCW